MLKIKDDIDLKELVKKNKFIEHNEKGHIYNKAETLRINMWDRKILFTPYNTINDSETVVVLYDLIQAGLVEKI
ncbi:MAG: hypothetical protein HFJ59_03965 [Clostridia bacterium]|nr:hypothetical protein [Clostridia bacterium]